MKSTIFWNVIPCSSLKVNHRFSACHLLLCRFHTQLILQHWTWRWYVPPKHPLTFNRLHGMFQKIELFIVARSLVVSSCLVTLISIMSHTTQDTLSWKVLGYPPHIVWTSGHVNSIWTAHSRKCYRAIDSVQEKMSRLLWCGGSIIAPGFLCRGQSSADASVGWLGLFWMASAPSPLNMLPIQISFKQSS
jgi:hypothetical protein